jgi:hypothetical protein
LVTVVAVNVAAILGVEIADDWPELIGMNSRSDIGNHPALKGSNTIKVFIAHSIKHNFPPMLKMIP